MITASRKINATAFRNLPAILAAIAKLDELSFMRLCQQILAPTESNVVQLAEFEFSIRRAGVYAKLASSALQRMDLAAFERLVNYAGYEFLLHTKPLIEAILANIGTDDGTEKVPQGYQEVFAQLFASIDAADFVASPDNAALTRLVVYQQCAPPFCNLDEDRALSTLRRQHPTVAEAAYDNYAVFEATAALYLQVAEASLNASDAETFAEATSLLVNDFLAAFEPLADAIVALYTADEELDKAAAMRTVFDAVIARFVKERDAE